MSWAFSRTVSSPLLVMLVAWSGPVHAQEYKGPMWGGSGGTSSYNLDCGSTGVMVGLYGKTGLWIDQIGITCQKINPDGTLGSEYTRGPVGGTGGIGKNARCTEGKAIRAMLSFTGSFVDKLMPTCCPWSATTRRVNGGTGMCFRIEIGDWGGVGVFTLVQNDTITCPPDKVGKALRGKYGSYIDSLQFVCDEYNK